MGASIPLIAASISFDAVIDDTVCAYIYLALCSFIHCHFVGTYIEADDDGVGSGSEHDVAFDNTADTGVDDIDLDFFVGKSSRSDCLTASADP